MKTKHLLFFIFIVNLISCSKKDPGTSNYPAPATNTSGRSNNQQASSGIVTAGEWNDLEHWDFWNGMMLGDRYVKIQDYWGFYPENRISVVVKDLNGDPIINAKVELVQTSYNSTYWYSVTDNKGKAELWINLNSNDVYDDLMNYNLHVNGIEIQKELRFISEGVNEITVDQTSSNNNTLEIAFVVDATGSMGDEIEFLKEDLKDVITRVESDNSNLSVLTSSVFYRDHNEEYLTKTSHFSADINTTLNFINQQDASGGGDKPEAVEIALNTALNDLQWSTASKSRIIFLLLDAPPHYTYDIKVQMHEIVKEAAADGIKIIPITASGIDLETEFLMRYLSIGTNSTYVFITNDSGVGNDHLEASVGNYETEKLNDLMVRLISKYGE